MDSEELWDRLRNACRAVCTMCDNNDVFNIACEDKETCPVLAEVKAVAVDAYKYGVEKGAELAGD